MLEFHPRRPALHHRHAEGVKLARLALIINVGDAAFWTILPIQLAILAGGDGPVGYYLSLIALVGILTSVFSSSLLQGRRKIVLGTVALSVMALLLAGMSRADGLWQLAVFDIPRSVAYLLVTIVLGLLVAENAGAANLAMEEGRYFLFSNLGWLVGPLLAGYVARYVSIEAVFVMIAGLFAVALGYLWRLHLTSHPALAAESDIPPSHEAVRGLVEFMASPRLRRVFALATGVELWWVVSSIYIPLAVIDLGFGPDVVGWVVAGGIVPLVLLEEWVGQRAQSSGTRPYLVAGFVTLAIGAASFTVLGFSSQLLLVMFAAVNIGVALVEPLTDTYFFEVATADEEERFFGIYNAAGPLASLFAPLAGALLLTAGLGLNGIWVVTALLMLACARIALGIVPPL